MGRAQERIEGVLEPGESIKAEAPVQPPKTIGSGGSSIAVVVTDRRVLFFKANSVAFGANTGKLVQEVPLSSVKHVEMTTKHIVGIIPVVHIDMQTEGDDFSMAASGIGVSKARRLGSALQALIEEHKGQKTQEQGGF